MTELETQIYINNLKMFNTFCNFDGSKETIQAAIQALEKQIPKKMDMYYTRHTGDLIYKCPTCRESYNRFYYGKPYCLTCGQAIDWSEEE